MLNKKGKYFYFLDTLHFPLQYQWHDTGQFYSTKEIDFGADQTQIFPIYLGTKISFHQVFAENIQFYRIGKKKYMTNLLPFIMV